MLRVFGPARVDGVHEGQPLGSRRQRQVLAALACRPGRPVQGETLAEWLWAGAPPSDPGAALQTVVHRLRRSLGDAAVVETRGDAYLLLPPEDGIDTVLFEEQVRRARTAVPEEAADLLTGARSLWRGEPYADLDHPDHVAERVRLHGLADECRRGLATAYLQAARYAEAVTIAEETLAEHPDEEGALAVVMTGLYATGDQVRALRRYSEHRDRLRDDLGLDPTPALRDLEQAILRQDLQLPGAGSGTRSVAEPGPRAPAPVTQRIRFCQGRDGTRIAYATSGHGPPLVKAATWLTHLNEDWTSPVWRHWMVGLSAEHTLLRYDERGCGLSEWEVADIGFDAWVDDLEEVVDAEGLESFPLLGISQGAAVAIAYAARHPDRVSALVLYGGYARGRELRAGTEEQRREAALHLELARIGWGTDDPAFRQVFTSQIMPDASREVWEAFNTLQRRTCSPANAVRFMEAFGRIDVTGLAPLVRCPTLVMHARDEVRQPVQIGLELASLIPGARFEVLPSRNHLLTADEPAWPLFLEHLSDFVGAGERATRAPGPGVVSG